MQLSKTKGVVVAGARQTMRSTARYDMSAASTLESQHHDLRVHAPQEAGREMKRTQAASIAQQVDGVRMLYAHVCLAYPSSSNHTCMRM